MHDLMRGQCGAKPYITIMGQMKNDWYLQPCVPVFSHALGMSVGWLVQHFGPKISTTTWIDMQFATDIHGTQRMNPNDFSDPPTFPLAPP